MAEKKLPFRLKGHEKFSLREGWLNKGLIAVEEDARVFLGGTGPDELGVGNNMVKSIRYWLRAFGLVEEVPGRGAEITQLGRILLDNDRYFEDIFTIWIIHSNLSKNIKDATTWYMFFNRLEVEEFSKEEIKSLLSDELVKYVGHKSFPDSSVKDDIDVLLNMYCKEKAEDYDPEDKNSSPLAILGLINKNKDTYVRKQPNISKLSEWVILYELQNLFGNENSISIEKISVGKFSLGSIYNLSKVTINDYLDKLENMRLIKVVRTAGLDVIYKTNDIERPEDVIIEYYNEHRAR